MVKAKKSRAVSVHRNPKWDWDVIHALYMGGMDVGDILKVPEFQKLSKCYLENKIYKEGWAEERKKITLMRKSYIGLSLEEKFKVAQKRFYEFFLKQTEEEMEIIRCRSKQTDISTQKQRIDLLKGIWDVSAKALGVEDAAPGCRDSQSFKIMFALQNGQQPAIAITTQPVVAKHANTETEKPVKINEESVNILPADLDPTPEELLNSLRNQSGNISLKENGQDNDNEKSIVNDTV